MDHSRSDDQGMGTSPSWKGFLAGAIEEERPDGFFGKWHSLFQTTFLDREFFEKVYNHMRGLLEACPEERFLVHGGYGYNNVLAQDGKATSVLDWINAIYGDFVYDIVWIDLWPPPGVDYPELFRQYYTSQGIPLPHYRERLACYQCYMGLIGMRFYAKTNNRDAYLSTCQILQNLMTAGNVEKV